MIDPALVSMRSETLDRRREDKAFQQATAEWVEASCRHGYSYHFDWLGRPIIQYPQDMVALQEILWEVRPSVVVECGIAHGGSLVLVASMLALIDQCEAVERGEEWLPLVPTDMTSRVVGVDVDIREHNRREIEAHPLSGRIHLVEGSSTDPAVAARVLEEVGDRSPVVVLLDSNHTAGHVRDELVAYADLTTVGSYCVVYDTVIEHLPADLHDDRPWGPGDSPATAVDEFLADADGFHVDRRFDARLGITVAPGGYLRRHG